MTGVFRTNRQNIVVPLCAKLFDATRQLTILIIIMADALTKDNCTLPLQTHTFKTLRLQSYKDIYCNI